MLMIDEKELRLLESTEIRRCAKCDSRATWEETGESFCGWCILYSGSAWGNKNRDEILAMGIMARQQALAGQNPRAHVPVLDERHRLSREDAERLMLGVAYTSQRLRPALGGANV